MKHYRTHSGFILVMTLLIIALAMLMTSVMFNQGDSYIPYMQLMIDRQKASMLAHSGLAIIESQLCASPIKKEKNEEAPLPKPTQNTEEQDTQVLLRTLIPHLNRWQTFNFAEEQDGIDGTLRICLMSEEGKININTMYDFETKKFKDEQSQSSSFKSALAAVCTDIEKNIQAKDLFSGLEHYLQKRNYPLNDVTELLTIKAFEPFKNNLYYEPSSDKKNKQKSNNRACALTDIFTTTSSDTGVQPWVLSESLRTLLHIPASTQVFDIKQTELVTETVQRFKLQNKWQSDWDNSLKLLYGVEFNQLPKYSTILMRDNGSLHYFSALIHSTVGNSTQRLYVILERIKKSHDTKTVYQIVIRSYYWL